MSTKKILVVSDLHCGANTAICIPDFEINDERGEIATTVKANKVQENIEYMYNYLSQTRMRMCLNRECIYNYKFHGCPEIYCNLKNIEINDTGKCAMFRKQYTKE